MRITLQETSPSYMCTREKEHYWKGKGRLQSRPIARLAQCHIIIKEPIVNEVPEVLVSVFAFRGADCAVVASIHSAATGAINF